MAIKPTELPSGQQTADAYARAQRHQQTLPFVRMVVHVLSSERDRNGNSYHAAMFTDTMTGAHVVVGDVGTPSNAAAEMAKLGLRLGEYLVIESTIPKRQWQAATRKWPGYIADIPGCIRDAVAAVCCPDGMGCTDPTCKAIMYRA